MDGVIRSEIFKVDRISAIALVLLPKLHSTLESNRDDIALKNPDSNRSSVRAVPGRMKANERILRSNPSEVTNAGNN